MNALQSIWEMMNSPIGMAVAAALLAWLLKRLYIVRPAWNKYEGTIISAIKFAEKQIPDDHANKAMARLDMALKYVVQVHLEATGKAPDQKLKNDLHEGIRIKHAELEADGCLGTKPNGERLGFLPPPGEAIPIKNAEAEAEAPGSAVRGPHDEGTTG